MKAGLPILSAQFLTYPPMVTVECHSAETARAAVELLSEDDNVELVCPADPSHRLWYPIGLLDIEPAPWCLCVPVEISVPLSVRDNHMLPAQPESTRSGGQDVR